MDYARLPLGIGDLMIDFSLPSADYQKVRVSDYRNKNNLILVFTGDLSREKVNEVLIQLSEHRPSFRQENGEVLAVLPYPMEDVQQIQRDGQYPFPLLADEEGQVHTQITGSNPAGGRPLTIFVTDRFGEVFAIEQKGPQENEPRLMEEIYEWLSFIELQCPE